MKPKKKNSLEIRFGRIVSQLRNCRVTPDTKELEKDISYKIDFIQKHQFEFFPGFYLYHEIQELDNMVKELQNTQGVKRYGV